MKLLKRKACRHSLCLVPIVFIFIALAIVPVANACNVPVFRYALERWEAGLYGVIVHIGPNITPEQQEIITFLEDQSWDYESGFNYIVQKNEEAEETRVELWYPQINRPEKPLLTGELSKPFVKTILDSPKRQEVATRLLDGQCGVWVLLESGNKDKDDKAFDFLNKQLRHMEEVLQLPTAPVNDLPIEIDESEEELKLQYSSLRVSRTDPKEKAFVEQLVHSEYDLGEYADEPIVFPIFGRGRALFALVGAGINDENIQEAAMFLVGPCSCIVKDMNPGTDLLIPVHWASSLTTRMVKDREVPDPMAFLNEPVETQTTKGEKSSSLLNNILIVFGFIVVINVIAFLVLRKRTTN
ncbi:hypothetical protein GF373_04435 [bacterium]|nr:hypothetical protein [bacterium]